MSDAKVSKESTVIRVEKEVPRFDVPVKQLAVVATSETDKKVAAPEPSQVWPNTVRRSRKTIFRGAFSSHLGCDVGHILESVGVVDQ
jgi:hypothetical protein